MNADDMNADNVDTGSQAGADVRETDSSEPDSSMRTANLNAQGWWAKMNRRRKEFTKVQEKIDVMLRKLYDEKE